MPVFFLFSCQNKTSEVLLPERGGIQPTQLNYNASITYSSNGKVTTQIDAPLIARYQVKDSAWFELYQSFEVNFYDTLGKVESTLNADSGLWSEKEGYMRAWSQVQFCNADSQRLYTSELLWLQDSAVITTDKPVKIVRKDGTIYGTGLLADEDFSSWTINKISGELTVEEKNDSTRYE